MEGELLLQERYGTKQRFYVKPPGQPQTIVVCETEKSYKLTSWLKQTFLPQGFPESTSRDYVEYQIFDTAQAFCSTIIGILATKEIMRSVGVGDEAATPLAATVTWVLKDGCGHLGRILFAYAQGACLDAYSKTWRLYADILNDIALIIELSLPYYMEVTTVALCVSTTFKAIVGVAGSATRSALTQHHAVRSNLADVSAKDSAQETAVNLFASMVALFILTYCGTTFGLYQFLIVTHLACNYCAVKAVCLETFNPPRFMLTLDSILKNEQYPGVRHINYKEPIIHMSKFRTGEEYSGFQIKLGSSAKDSILSTTQVPYLKKLLEAYKRKPFVPYVNLQTRVVNILLKDDATPVDVLEGYYHGILFILATLAVNDINIPFMEFTAVFNDSEWAQARSSHGTNFQYELSEQGIEFLQHLLSMEWNRVKDGLISCGWNVSSHQMVVDEWRLPADEDTSRTHDLPQEAVEEAANPVQENPIAARALVNGRWNTARNVTRNTDYIRTWVDGNDNSINDNDRMEVDDYGAGPSGLRSDVYTHSDDDDSYSD